MKTIEYFHCTCRITCDRLSAEWISCRCFGMIIHTLCIHKYNAIDGIVCRKFKKRYQFQYYKKHYKVYYWLVIRGRSRRGDLKEVSFLFVLLGGGNYHMLALLRIPTFDLYMILCSRQIIYINNCSVVKLSFDRRSSILHNWDLSTC